MSTATWTLVARSATLARSAHCLAINRGTAYIYSGELKPRMPVDTEDNLVGCLHSLNLVEDSAPWNLLSAAKQLNAGSKDTVPTPRVGAATATINDYLYLWGGRGGTDMSPIGGKQIGMWRTKFNKDSVEWEILTSGNAEAAPEPRSFHTMVEAEGKLYIHAGCPTTGRLGSLHVFDPKTILWSQLSDAPEPGRGGTVLISSPLNKKSSLLRFGGFAGYELGADHKLDIYDIASNAWKSVIPTPDPDHGHPGARSVNGFASFTSKVAQDAIAVLFHGERDASTLGHAGAGTFWDDVWMLSYHYSSEAFSWKKLAVNGSGPEARGWFPSAIVADYHGTTGIAMFGGLLSSNQRADDLWVLTVQ